MAQTSTFATEIANIKSSSLSRAQKREALLKMGIRSNEITLILGNEPSQPRMGFTFCYGVELETVCSSFDHVNDALEAAGINVYNARCYFHSNGNVRFELKTDSSINADLGCCGVEVVSSILSSDDKFKTIKKACKALEAAGATVNKSTGYHVHVSTTGMNDEWFSNVFANYAHAEAVIDTFMPRSRRANNNTYCDTLADHKASLDLCHTIHGVQHALNISRYHKVNPMAYNSHGTIEFRQHGGTVNAEKVVKWVEFCAALVAWSKDHRLDHDITSIDEMAWLKASLKTYYKGRAEALSGAIAA